MKSLRRPVRRRPARERRWCPARSSAGRAEPAPRDNRRPGPRACRRRAPPPRPLRRAGDTGSECSHHRCIQTSTTGDQEAFGRNGTMAKPFGGRSGGDGDEGGGGVLVGEIRDEGCEVGKIIAVKRLRGALQEVRVLEEGRDHRLVGLAGAGQCSAPVECEITAVASEDRSAARSRARCRRRGRPPGSRGRVSRDRER